MNSNEIKGKIKQATGSVQREFGKATGSTSDQLKGTAKKAVGEVQETIGNKQEKDKNNSSY